MRIGLWLLSTVVLLLTSCALLESENSKTIGRSRHASTARRLIGDIDGFGISPTSGLVRATLAPHTQPADVDGDGIVEPGEFLPDWNKDGTTAVGSGDEFDFRSASEQAATDGAQWTDRALTPTGADGATFVFNFTVPSPGDADFGVDHFVNFVFGDFDVSPASIVVDGVTVDLTVQGGGADGLVQQAFAPVPWASMTDGQVVVTVKAPNEPYMAFDYGCGSFMSPVDGSGSDHLHELEARPTSRRWQRVRNLTVGVA
jgi:hypothetical protein